MVMEIFIPYNTPSLKNSKVKTSRGIFPSKTVTSYLRNLGIKKFSSSKKIVEEYKNKENLFKTKFVEQEWSKPIEQIVVGFHFVRNSKRSFDFHNAVQIVADLMVAHDFIEDDSMEYFIPQCYKKNKAYYSYSKENPGVWIKINSK
jgi:hypothetical protein